MDKINSGNFNLNLSGIQPPISNPILNNNVNTVSQRDPLALVETLDFDDIGVSNNSTDVVVIDNETVDVSSNYIEPMSMKEFEELYKIQEKYYDEQANNYVDEYSKVYKEYTEKFLNQISYITEIDSEHTYKTSDSWIKLVNEKGSIEEALKYISSQVESKYKNYEEALESGDEYAINQAVERLREVANYLSWLPQYKSFAEVEGEGIQVLTDESIVNIVGNFRSGYNGLQDKMSTAYSNWYNATELKKMAIYNNISLTSGYQNYSPKENHAPSRLVDIDEDYSGLGLSKMYNYLYENYGEDAANTYWVKIFDNLDRYEAEIEVNKQLEKYNENPDAILEYLENTFNATGDGLTAGISEFLNGFSGWGDAFGTVHDVSKEDYEKLYLLNALMSQSEKEAYGLIALGSDGKYYNTDSNSLIDYTISYGDLNEVYELSSTVGYMAIPMTTAVALTYTVGPEVGSWAASSLIFASSGGNAVSEYRQQGANPLESLVGGFITGSSEALLEKYLGNIFGANSLLANSVKEKGAKGIVAGLKTMMAGMPGEILEENLQNYVGYLTDYVMLGKEVSVNQMFQDTIKTSIYSFALSFLFNTGGIAGKNMVENAQTIINMKNADIINLAASYNLELTENDVNMMKQEAKVVSQIPEEHYIAISDIIMNDGKVYVDPATTLSKEEYKSLVEYVKGRQKYDPDFKIQILQKTKDGEIVSGSADIMKEFNEINTKEDLQTWINEKASIYDLSGLDDTQKSIIYDKLIANKMLDEINNIDVFSSLEVDTLNIVDKSYDPEMELAFFDEKNGKKSFIDKLKSSSKRVIDDNDLTSSQKKWIAQVNQILDNSNDIITIRLKNTMEITGSMLNSITDLSRLKITIESGFSDINGNFKSKYNSSKYLDRCTYTGYEALSIVNKLDELQSKIDLSLPTVERAYQIYKVLAKEIPVMRDYDQYVDGHKISASLRGLTTNNSVGKSGLVCAGYASAYKELCVRCNILCDYIRGLGISDPIRGSAGPHAWNVIFDDNGNILPVDVTWKACADREWFGKSEDFANTHIADVDEQFQNYRPDIKKIDSYKDFNNTNSVIENIINTMNQKYGEGSGMLALEKYISTGDKNVITRTNNARELLEQISIDDIDNYLLANSINYKHNQLCNIENIMDQKYGTGSGRQVLIDYITNGNLNAITRTNNARQKIQIIPINDIINYINGTN